MALHLVAENYRCIARADWTQEPGVSLLVGPNGSGKTTLLDIPALLRDALEKGTSAAIDEHGGPGNIVNLRTGSAEVAHVSVEVGDQKWSLALRPRGAQLGISQRLLVGDKQIQERHVPSFGSFTTTYAFPTGRAIAPDTEQSALPLGPTELVLVEPSDSSSPEPKAVAERSSAIDLLAESLRGYLVHGGYFVRGLRVNGSRMSSDLRVDRDGANAFSVLRNWRDARATEPRWNFVIKALGDAFPESFEGLGFESAGQTVAAQLYMPGLKEPIAAYFAPDGVLTGLLHLAAVASVPDGGAIAIDEFENALHPYAIRALLEHTRAWADEHRLSVTLATHSPVLIDQFKEEPSRVLVMEQGVESVPVSIDKLRDPEWLAHFSLGDLYSTEEFGAQGHPPTH
jgi:predicted ATPase